MTALTKKQLLEALEPVPDDTVLFFLDDGCEYEPVREIALGWAAQRDETEHFSKSVRYLEQQPRTESEARRLCDPDEHPVPAAVVGGVLL